MITYIRFFFDFQRTDFLKFHVKKYGISEVSEHRTEPKIYLPITYIFEMSFKRIMPEKLIASVLAFYKTYLLKILCLELEYLNEPNIYV